MLERFFHLQYYITRQKNVFLIQTNLQMLLKADR